MLPPGRTSKVADFLKKLYRSVHSLKIHPENRYAIDFSEMTPEWEHDDSSDFFEKLNKQISLEFKIRGQKPATNNRFSELFTTVITSKCS